jgi:hypothetical protein
VKEWKIGSRFIAQDQRQVTRRYCFVAFYSNLTSSQVNNLILIAAGFYLWNITRLQTICASNVYIRGRFLAEHGGYAQALDSSRDVSGQVSGRTWWLCQGVRFFTWRFHQRSLI